MSHSLSRIFAAGIVWDPREPLPEEYQADPYYQHDWRPGGGRDNLDLAGGSLRPRPGDGLTQFPPAQPHDAFFVHSVVPPPGVVVPTTTTVKKPAPKTLPDLTVQEAGRNVLPPLSISLAASVIQDTAEVTVTQTFWNNAAKAIKEAAYTFPLPTECTVTDFSCRIGTNRIIRGSVKPREEAREAFQHHIRHHKTGAALLEQDTPEVFTTTLGNIPPETRLKVTLSFITVLKHRFSDSLGTTTLTIPTYIASRYGPPPEGYQHAGSKDVPQGLTLKIEIMESEKVQSITSPSHGVTVDHRKGKATAESFADLAGEDSASQVETALVQLEGSSIFLDKDFVLDIVTHPNGDNETPQAWLEEHPTIPDQKALMVTLPPKFLGQTTPAQMEEKGEILFLADQSGSMYDKISSLKSAMEFFLKGIPVGKTFNIWSFGSNYTSWCPQSVDYNEGTLSAALAHVEKTFADDMGGTELFPAIQAVVAARDKSLMTDVIVLTDGETWRLHDTLDFIQQTRIRTEGRVRFFSLGIGDGVSHTLVEGIAKAGGGYAEVVPSSVRDGWEDRVVSMLQASLSTAHLGPLHFDFALNDKTTKTSTPINLLSSESSQRSPADISTLSPFNHNRVYFLSTAPSIPRASKDSSIALSITSPLTPDAPLSIPVVVLPKKATTIHKLAARSLLNDLERGQSHIHLKQPSLYRGTWAVKSAIQREAEEIACKWGLVSKWTSFFLKEEPFEPKKGSDVDLFLDGAVIKATLGQGAMGEDLLQTRGSATASKAPAVEEAARGIEQAVEEPAEALPSIHDGRVVRVGEEDLAREMDARSYVFRRSATTAATQNYPSMSSFSATGEIQTYEAPAHHGQVAPLPWGGMSQRSAPPPPPASQAYMAPYPVHPPARAGTQAPPFVQPSAATTTVWTPRGIPRGLNHARFPPPRSYSSDYDDDDDDDYACALASGAPAPRAPAPRGLAPRRRSPPAPPNHGAPRTPTEYPDFHLQTGFDSAFATRHPFDPPSTRASPARSVDLELDPEVPVLQSFELEMLGPTLSGAPDMADELGLPPSPSPSSPARRVSFSLGHHVQTVGCPEKFGCPDEVYGARSSSSPRPESPEGSSRDRNLSRPPSLVMGPSEDYDAALALEEVSIVSEAVQGSIQPCSLSAGGKIRDCHSVGSRSRSSSPPLSRLRSDPHQRANHYSNADLVGSTNAELIHGVGGGFPSQSQSRRRSARSRSRSLSGVRSSATSSDAGPADARPQLAWNHKMGKRRRRRSPSPSPSVSSTRASPRAASPAPVADAPPLTEPAWIRLVLHHQKFNGAFSPPSTDPVAEVCLGKEILAVVDTLCASAQSGDDELDEQLHAFFLTLAIHVVLVRDFAAHAKLVALMKAKMWRFLQTECEARGGGKSLEAWRGEVEGLVAGLKVPVHVYLDKAGEGGVEGGAEEEGKEEVAVTETKAPGRELVLSAPFDD